MKEKMTNLGSIDKLLEFTFQRLMESATAYEQVTKKMEGGPQEMPFLTL